MSDFVIIVGLVKNDKFFFFLLIANLIIFLESQTERN